MGRYVKPRICNEDNLRAVSAALRRPGVRLLEAPFVDSVRSAVAGDLIYFDPPYAPLSATADFTTYTAARFTGADQQALQELTLELADRGCFVVVSNSTAPEIVALYRDDPRARRAGLCVHTVTARRAINCKPGSRGVVPEFIVTNVA